MTTANTQFPDARDDFADTGEDRVVIAGLLLALVLLLAFGVTVMHLVRDAERSKIAEVATQQGRMNCEMQALVSTRNTCHQALQSQRLVLSSAER